MASENDEVEPAIELESDEPLEKVKGGVRISAGYPDGASSASAPRSKLQIHGFLTQ